MAERRVNVGWAEGLHARPASIFVQPPRPQASR
ncbi:hypothetical protein SVIOM74S_01121 [Streptomyces violarus]